MNTTTATTTDVDDWTRLLDTYAETLDEHRAMLLAVAADRDAEFDIGPLPLAFAPPATMPPMPDELVPWARTLLGQTDGLTRLAAELVVRSEPRRSTRPAAAVALRPAALDALL